jgi:hypothetical protein
MQDPLSIPGVLDTHRIVFDHLATVLLALTNGLALERLGQADAVPDESFGEVIATLFRRR